MHKYTFTWKLIGLDFVASGAASTCTSARGSIGEASRAYCPHNECCHTYEEQEPAELKKIKKVKPLHDIPEEKRCI